MATHGLSVVRACQVAGLSRAASYTPLADRTEQDAAVIVEEHPNSRRYEQANSRSRH